MEDNWDMSVILRSNLHSFFFKKLVAKKTPDGRSAYIPADDLFIADIQRMMAQSASGSEFATIFKSYLNVCHDEDLDVQEECNTDAEPPREISITDSMIARARMHSLDNKKILQHSSRIGCYSCLFIFKSAEEIAAWWDDTGVCPKCGYDTLIGDVSGFPITRRFLNAVAGRSPESDDFDWRDLPPTIIVEFNGEDDEDEEDS